MKTQPATGETYPKSDLFNKARSQLKIINAINLGLNNNETAKNLGIDHRTVYSHKLRIMKKFQLENNQELIRFSSIVMRRTSLYFN
ncbi:helix-turn-helix domain-containing protein [Klebsiella michiganensis]|uniref:helix-turn-helix domain-containing protein n=1 Tax=Klebsiella michiganensis TaxID=1134687 RepID=UPI00294AB696|nr:helix-turn-helix transcriptional regulator [Klebsiella michiganensis]